MRYYKRIFSVIKSFVICFIVLLVFQCIIVHRVHAAEELDSLKELWRNRQYREVALKLLEYRKKPDGKNVVVDYLLATSLCRLSDFQEDAYNYFKWILYHYAIDSEIKELIEREMQRCSPNRPEPPIIIVSITEDKGPHQIFSEVYARAIGKKFYRLEEKNSPITMHPIKKVVDIPLDEFKSRLFMLSDRDVAVSKVKELVGPEFKVYSFGRFILASSSDHTPSDLKDIGEGLQRFLLFFKSNYEMTIPPQFITIYMVPYLSKLPELAEKIHGIKISEGSIGYSFQDDLSILGVIHRGIYGSLAHELFHIIVRNNFGDIPAWMEEGMAALYEVSEVSDNKVRGIKNWRGPVLREFWSKRPPIENLVKMNWASFNNAEYNYEAKQQAANHAMARYFMLYLQEKNKLIDVYKAFRDRKIEDMQADPGTDAVKLLESILSKPLSEVDRDFVGWFMNLHQ